MESFMLTGLALAGKSLVVNLIGDVYNLARDTGYHPEVKAVLNRLDLEADLRVVEALLHRIEDPRSFKTSKDISQDPVYICLDQVHQMISKIKEELEEIKIISKEHEQKWLANWRTPAHSGGLKAITHHKKILDKRVEMLIKILQLPTNKYSNNYY